MSQCATNQNKSFFSSTIFSVVNIPRLKSATSFHLKTTKRRQNIHDDQIRTLLLVMQPRSMAGCWWNGAQQSSSLDNGSYGEMVRALYFVYYRLPAAVIDQLEQDIAYVRTHPHPVLDPPSRRPDHACSIASLWRRDRLPSFSSHQYSRLRSPCKWERNRYCWLFLVAYSNQASARITFYLLDERNTQKKAWHSFLSFAGFPTKWNQDRVSHQWRREAKCAVGFLPRYHSYSMDGVDIWRKQIVRNTKVIDWSGASFKGPGMLAFFIPPE